MSIPKVSVIVSVYNTAEYLQECIDSLLAQDYPAEGLEFIFVDDGSKDNSLEILQKAAAGDSRIAVIHQENSGVSAARNAGIKASTGKYLMFCDSDDMVKFNWCSSMVEAIENHQTSWVVGGVELIDEYGSHIDFQDTPQASELSKSEYYLFFKKGISASVCNKIFSFDIISKHGILFDIRYSMGEDILFTLEYLDYTDSIFSIPKNLYQYRRFVSQSCERTSATTGYHKNDFEYSLAAYKLRCPYISDKYKVEFRKYYWRIFEKNFYDTFRCDTESSIWEKIRRNQRIVSNDDFHDLLLEFGREDFHPLFFWCLRLKVYYVFWLGEEIYKVLKGKF